MDDLDHDEFLSRIAKTLYYGKSSSFDSISLPLSELAAEIFSEVKKDNGLERLHVKEVAEFNQNACVSTCSLVLAILYLEKIKNTKPEYVEKIAPSELFLVSLLVASKFLNDDGEDESISNYSWSICAGLPLKKINDIEKKFLHAMDWNVSITERQFWSRLCKIEKYLANRAGKRRGWYSYTELNVLMTGNQLVIMRELLKLSISCVTCYAASVIVLITSGILAIHIKHILLQCILTATCANYKPVTINDLETVPATNTSNLLTEVKYKDVNASDTTRISIIDEKLVDNINREFASSTCDNPLSCYVKNVSNEFKYLRVKLTAVNWKLRRLRDGGVETVQKNSPFL